MCIIEKPFDKNFDYSKDLICIFLVIIKSIFHIKYNTLYIKYNK